MDRKVGFDENSAKEFINTFASQDLKGSKLSYALLAELLNLFVIETLKRAKAEGNGNTVKKEDLQKVVAQILLDFL